MAPQEKKSINRIKAVLAEKCKTNKWLAEQLHKDQATVSNGALIRLNQVLKL